MIGVLKSTLLMSRFAEPKAVSIARVPSSLRRRGAGEGSQIGLHSTAVSLARASCTKESIHCTLSEQTRHHGPAQLYYDQTDLP